MGVKELSEYRQFTKPAELHKAINTLKGLVAGITTDARVDGPEIAELVNWCSLHEHLRNRHPFNELLPMVDVACRDGIISEEESKDIIWLCNNFVSDASYYDLLTSSIQFLSGMMHGVMADGEISNDEIHALQNWVNHHPHLQGCYPFDEVSTLITKVLADGAVTDDERNMLKAFFSQFIDLKTSANLHEPDMAALRDQFSIQGICAMCPEIVFDERVFYFTGTSYKAKKAEIAQVIMDAGGAWHNSVTKKTDYLIVGNAGNPCWAFACYGRKIEEAVNLRKEGHRIMIINETDFWDAIEDLKLMK